MNLSVQESERKNVYEFSVSVERSVRGSVRGNVY